MFVMSILYILMMFAAPVINPNAEYVTMEFTKEALIPKFNVGYFTSLSILVFAVGGCEKISPYVNKVKDPSKGFPKGMIALAVMVMVCAILGTIAMGKMFDPTIINESKESFNSYVSNGSYWAFQKLGEYYGVGNALLIIYAACNAIGQFSTLVLSIDAPLRMLLDNEDARQFVPTKLLKKNDKGAFEAISWDQAYSEIAEKVKAIIADKGPQALAMVQDPRPSGKYYSKRFMNALGSPNVYAHSSSCNLSKESAYQLTIGATGYSNDFANAKMVMFIGRSYGDGIRPSSVMSIASAVAVPSSSSEQLPISMPVSEITAVWKFSSASRRPCEISA